MAKSNKSYVGGGTNWQGVLKRECLQGKNLDGAMRLKEVLALTPVHTQGDGNTGGSVPEGSLLIPDVNHHWFNGFSNVNIKEMMDIYLKFIDDDCCEELEISQEVSFMVFRDVSKGDKIKCELRSPTSETFENPKFVAPVSITQKNEFFDLLTSFRTEHEHTDLQKLRDLVRKRSTSFYVAPIDGLHRLMILNHLANKDGNIERMSNSRTFDFRPKFYFLAKDFRGKIFDNRIL